MGGSKIFGVFWGKNPENRRFSGRGRGTQYRGFSTETPKTPKLQCTHFNLILSNPGEPRPPPRSSGTGWGRGNFFKIFGDGVGTGEGRFLGFFRGKNPENRRFSGWGRGKQFRGLGTYFGDLDNPNFRGIQGNFWGFPEKSPKLFFTLISFKCTLQMFCL